MTLAIIFTVKPTRKSPLKNPAVCSYPLPLAWHYVARTLVIRNEALTATGMKRKRQMAATVNR